MEAAEAEPLPDGGALPKHFSERRRPSGLSHNSVQGYLLRMTGLEPRRALPLVGFLVFFAVLNETVFVVSTPAISSQFKLSPAGVSWMMTSFIVLFGICTMIFSRLADLYPVRRLLTIGVLTYASASLLGFLGRPSYPVVLLARALQGIGGAALPSLVTVIIVRWSDPGIRGRLFGTVTSVISCAAAFGPVLGGFVSREGGWPFLFLIPLLTLVALPRIPHVVPAEDKRPGRIDLLGALLMALGVGTLIVWLTVSGWPWLVAGSILLAAFILRVATADRPFIDLKLFRNAAYRAGVVTVLAVNACFFGLWFLQPLWFHSEIGIDTSIIGLVLFPSALSGVFFGPFAGRLADARGNRFVLRIGLCLMVSGLVLLPLAVWLLPGRAGTFAPFLLALVNVVPNLGYTFFNTGLINGVSRTLSAVETGAGMGLFNLAGFVASAVGTSLVGRALDSRLLDHGHIVMVLAGLVGATSVGYLLALGRRVSRTSPAGFGSEPEGGSQDAKGMTAGGIKE